MIKKTLLIFIAWGLIQGALGFYFFEDVKAMPKGEFAVKEERNLGTASSGGWYLAQKPSRVVRLMGPAASQLSLPPPCSVVNIQGMKITLRDFYGHEEIVVVEDAKDIKVGDKVVVKDGMLTIGISLR